MAELMGAYGAALTASDAYNSNGHTPSSFIGLENLDTVDQYDKKLIRCRGCENKCTVTKIEFPNGNVFYSGNRCEKMFTNGGKAERQGVNLPAIKYEMLFNRQTTQTPPPG